MSGEQLCTDPSPIRKFRTPGCGDANTARPGGGIGGGRQLPAVTPAANALGERDVLPKQRRLDVVPQGLPTRPMPPHTCTRSPARMVQKVPSGMDWRIVRRVGGLVRVGKT